MPTVSKRASKSSLGFPGGWKADLSLLAITAVWGSSFVIVRDTLRELDPLILVGLRFTIATVIMAALLTASRRLKWTRSELWYGLGLGVFLGAGFLLQTVGLTATTAANSAFITGLLVVFTPVFAALTSRSWPEPGNLLAVVVAAAGLATLTYRPESGMSAGDLVTLGCAIAFAWHIVFTARALDGGSADPLRLNLFQFLMVAALSFAAAFARGISSAPVAPSAGAILYLAVFATVGAYFVQTSAQSVSSETKVAVIFTMEPVFAALIAYTVGEEASGPRLWAGGGLIVIAMMAAELLPRARSRRAG